MNVENIQGNISVSPEFVYLTKLPAIYYRDIDAWRGSVLRSTTYVKWYGLINKMLKATPPHAVPLELGLLSFLLVNIYKSAYVTHTMSDLQRYTFLIPVIMLVFLETPSHLNLYSLHFWNVIVVFLSCFMLQSRLFICTAVFFLTCVSLPVHFLVDLVFYSLLIYECWQILPFEHFNQVLTCSLFCLVLQNFVMFILKFGFIMYVHVGVFFNLTAALFLVCSLAGNYALKFHVLYAVFFPTLVNFLIDTLPEGETLTYCLPDFKPLKAFSRF